MGRSFRSVFPLVGDCSRYAGCVMQQYLGSSVGGRANLGVLHLKIYIGLFSNFMLYMDTILL